MPTRLLRALLLVAASAAPAAAADHEVTRQTRQRSVLVATIEAECGACSWETPGREAVTLVVSLNGTYSQHVPLVRRDRSEYAVLLGMANAGTHVVRVAVDPEQTSAALRSGDAATFRIVDVSDTYNEHHPEYLAMSFAPILYARANTLGRFTDVPVFMWYETEPADGGTRYRYSVIFTNEDGGTPADRLMATWGRTTDIEYVYGVVVDRHGRVLTDDYQGPEHEILRFSGRREGRQPLLWVTTDNNMVRDSGETRVRYALAPRHVSLQDVSRETVMDQHRWLYAVMSQELQREGKIVADAPAGNGTIRDPRQFVYIEACGDVGTSALAFAVQAAGVWVASDRGRPDYRITRNGCFRVAIPLPESAREDDVAAVRAQAFARPPREGAPAPAPTDVRLTRINTVFMLDERYQPGTPRLQWHGTKTLTAGGPPVEFALR